MASMNGMRITSVRGRGVGSLRVARGALRGLSRSSTRSRKLQVVRGLEADKVSEVAPMSETQPPASQQLAVEESAAADAENERDSAMHMKMALAALVAVPVMSVAPDAFAKGGELGILEGRTLALLHPAMMYTLLATTAYTGYLGWQWRRVRTIGDEIAELKKSVKSPELVTANGATEASEPVVSPVDAEINSLTATRKELIAGKFKDKHFALSSLLLGAGVTFSIEGCLNTFTRTGKLFPGPHLWAGAGITALWAIGAALVPQMQKGSKVAKDTHVALNALAFGLFLWQVPTGMQIVDKVFQFTKWP